MYGEDIDLSYRLLLGGYQNYYLPSTNIIHYKGESTKRGSLNYVRVFYQAMIIFAKKHFAGSQARTMVWLMQLGIYVRAILAVLATAWRTLRYPLLDAGGIYLGLLLLKSLWSEYHFGDAGYFPGHINYVHFPAYTLLWTGSIFLGGGYEHPFDFGRLLRSLGVGTLLLLALYGLLPESLRPSRALLLLGAAWAGTWTLLVRGAAHLLKFGHLRVASSDDQRLLIVGSAKETERTLSLLQRAGVLGRLEHDGLEARRLEVAGLVDPAVVDVHVGALGGGEGDRSADRRRPARRLPLPSGGKHLRRRPSGATRRGVEFSTRGWRGKSHYACDGPARAPEESPPSS